MMRFMSVASPVAPVDEGNPQKQRNPRPDQDTVDLPRGQPRDDVGREACDRDGGDDPVADPLITDNPGVWRDIFDTPDRGGNQSGFHRVFPAALTALVEQMPGHVTASP